MKPRGVDVLSPSLYDKNPTGSFFSLMIFHYYPGGKSGKIQGARTGEIVEPEKCPSGNHEVYNLMLRIYDKSWIHWPVLVILELRTSDRWIPVAHWSSILVY